MSSRLEFFLLKRQIFTVQPVTERASALYWIYIVLHMFPFNPSTVLQPIYHLYVTIYTPDAFFFLVLMAMKSCVKHGLTLAPAHKPNAGKSRMWRVITLLVI